MPVIAQTLNSILSAYHKQHNLTQVPIKIDFLKPIVEERGWVDKIFWEKFRFNSQFIAAQVSFFKGSMGVYAGSGDYARIQYSENLNFCWERFAICKEMYHCMIDNDQSTRITNSADLLKLVEYLVSGQVSAIEEFPAHASEDIAEILAIETLFPLELRKVHRSAYEKNEITDLQLALRYRLPEKFVRTAMYPSYYAQIEKLRKDTLVL
jgi:hypothetical protein